MLFIPFGGKRDFWACIKDLDQHYWYMNFTSLIPYFPISLSIIDLAMLNCDAGCWTKFSNKLFGV